MESYGIVALRSRQQALVLESALRREGIRAQMISTPRDVALGCGLSVLFPLEQQSLVRHVVAQVHPTNMVGIYRVDRQGGRTHLTALSK